MSDPLSPFFLGAYAENDDLFEKLLVEFVRDHVFWRRNFHPGDAPPIGAHERYEPGFLDGLARTRRALHTLTARLKGSVPFFHPRYLGHMVSDSLLPGLIAQLVTTLYNPNNVVEESAPVTVQLEREVVAQLARMLGYRTEPSAPPCAGGHLTSGGTVANIESLWLARAVKLYPLAARDACEALGEWPEPALRDADDAALLRWAPARSIALAAHLRRLPRVAAEVVARRAEAVGLAAFSRRHPLVSELVVLAPRTAHYSWQKAMRLLGLGASQLVGVATHGGRLDVAALDAALADCEARGRPVLAAVAVYGTTEFGTIDPLHEVAARRAAHGFWLHVDAAWGGYLPSVFRDAAGALRGHHEVRADFRYFPSEHVYRSTAALPDVDSVTVDPHKMGFVPFGCGALLTQDRRAFDLVMQDARYVFVEAEDGDARFDRPGRFSLEGSRPGAPAAACFVNHSVLPLDAAHFGRVIGRTIQSCEALFDDLARLNEALAGVARVALPFEPDTNLVCFAVNPHGNASLSRANAFGRALYEAMAVRADVPVQLRQFYASCTTVPLDELSPGERERLSTALALPLTAPDAAGLFVLRHTLMNPWLTSTPEGGPTYLERYVRTLGDMVRAAAQR